MNTNVSTKALNINEIATFEQKKFPLYIYDFGTFKHMSCFF